MKNALKWIGVLAVVSGLTGLAGCNSNSTSPYGTQGNNSGNSTTNAPNTIVMYNMAFGPGTLTVSKGTSVTWTNSDDVPHTATSDTGAWDSGTIQPGGSKSVMFNTVGSFPYHCTVHPMMTATIVVQ